MMYDAANVGGVAALNDLPTDVNDPLRNRLVDWMTKYLSDLTGLAFAEIDISSTFDRYGMDSYQGVVFAYELEQWLGCEIEASAAFEQPTIALLADFLAARPAIRAALSNRVAEVRGRVE